MQSLRNAYIFVAGGVVLLVQIICLARAVVSWLRFRRQWREAVQRHEQALAELRAKTKQGASHA
ncbi:hypothetical protein CBR67_03860 [Bordetella hinzii]|nr:hypothetical protein CBR67_03860 [Bordetella hinzii]